MHFHFFLFILCNFFFHFVLVCALICFEFICFLGGRQANVSDFVVFVSTFDSVHHTLSVASISFIIGEVSRCFLLSTDRCLAFIFFVPLLPFLLLTYHPPHTRTMYIHIVPHPSSRYILLPSRSSRPLSVSPLPPILPVYCPTVCFIPTHWPISQILYLYMTIAVTCAYLPRIDFLFAFCAFSSRPLDRWQRSIFDFFVLRHLRPLCLVLGLLPEVPVTCHDSRSYLLVFVELLCIRHIRLVVSLSDACESSKYVVSPQWRWRVACIHEKPCGSFTL